jgi:hypothetical protein
MLPQRVGRSVAKSDSFIIQEWNFANASDIVAAAQNGVVLQI